MFSFFQKGAEPEDPLAPENIKKLDLSFWPQPEPIMNYGILNKGRSHSGREETIVLFEAIGVLSYTPANPLIYQGGSEVTIRTVKGTITIIASFEDYTQFRDEYQRWLEAKAASEQRINVIECSCCRPRFQ